MPNYVLRKLKHIVVVAAISFLAILQSCEKTPVGELVSLEIRNVEVDMDAGEQFVAVEAIGDWTLEIEGGCDWASLSKTSGNGNCASIVLKYIENKVAGKRQLSLLLSNTESSIRAVFYQLGTGLNPDPVASWLEIPATDENDGRFFFSCSMTAGSPDSKTFYNGRNYSFYYDPESYTSVWVAYPLNGKLMGGSDIRPNPDPWHFYDTRKIPSNRQLDLSRSFGGGYQRGHQIPSRDRCANSESNYDTFAAPNVTPQLGDLNEGSWATLEKYVRDWARDFDTLYVVTGADVARSKGGYYSIPNGFFKALLGYKKGGTLGITPTTGGYTAIGFYFKHQSYSDSQIMAQSMTIDELEKKTGFDFFVNLPSKIGDTLADRVESTEDSWWQASK